ncbi:alpha/beta hydrolase [Nocardioides panacis]|uniref:Alpha/beta hydrolase n=1 Tax=Nocardioides panacis TaxID=2849501 RepID=A0A975SZU7_9ACTN|nr:alpha/beta hydrolase [Nocardioides panacis]QWZ08999.1 alpha/beta hydrolase [Nocardioides panacis]
MSATPRVVSLPVPGGHESLRFYDVVSADGTRLRAWTNDADGPTVLLCNGLGTSPYAWPALLRSDCGVRVISWNHRGIGGSERPADRRRVDVSAFVEDALAVLADAEVDACPVIGWSIGVNTAFELAVEHPARVTALFAVAGVPGGTFASMGAPLQIPRWARRPLSIGVASTLARTGWALTPVTSRLPVGRRAANLLRHSGFMMPNADLAVVERAVREFLSTPVQWYMHLARAAARHDRVSLSRVTVPTVFVAGSYDILASAQDMRTAAERIPGSTYVEMRGSHFLQIERAAEVHALLLALVSG